MKTGTPGFIGARLREAREARGLTAISLAELLGITRAAVSLYETDNASPQPEIMHKIANTLNLPVTFFLRPYNEIDDTIFFRSMSAATKTARIRGRRWYEWLRDILVPYLRQFVEFPQVKIPYFSSSSSYSRLTDRDIESIASNVRKFWGLGEGPISNIMLLMENNGALVARIELGAATLDAFSTWSSIDNTPYIVLGSEKGSMVRSRFDISHELGHLVLHRDIDQRSLANTRYFRLIEEQANRFASSLLLPAPSFAGDFYAGTLDVLQTLKAKWLVSIGMMIKRAADLEFITKEHARRLWINYNRRGWRRAEPLDDRLQVERPRLLRRAINLLFSEQVQAPEQLLMSLPLSQSDIEDLAALTHGYLSSTSPQIELKQEYASKKNAEYERVIREAENILRRDSSE